MERYFESPLTQNASTYLSSLVDYQISLAALNNLAVLQTEVEQAAQVQNSLIPIGIPLVTGLDCWFFSRSASSLNGDFYEYICGKDQAATLMVGDVSGKGIPAALLAAMIHGVIRTWRKDGVLPTPKEMIAALNKALYQDFTRAGMFATVFILQYEPSRQEFLYANAGHSPVIYKSAAETALLMEADGTGLGILPETEAEDHSLILRRGDYLVVGTDGLTDARNGCDQYFGYERLLQVVEQMDDLPAAAIGAHLNHRVTAFQDDQRQEDDQTILVIKRSE